MKSGPSACLIYLSGSGALLTGIWVSSCLPVSPAWCSLEDSCTHTLASQATSTLAAPSNTSTGSQLAIYPSPDPDSLIHFWLRLWVFPERGFPPICQLVQLEVCWWITHIYTEENTLVPSVAYTSDTSALWPTVPPAADTQMLSYWHHRHMDHYYLGCDHVAGP